MPTITHQNKALHHGWQDQQQQQQQQTPQQQGSSAFRPIQRAQDDLDHHHQMQRQQQQQQQQEAQGWRRVSPTDFQLRRAPDFHKSGDALQVDRRDESI